MNKMIRISDEHHSVVAMFAKARGRTLKKQLELFIDRCAPKVPEETMNRTRKSIGGK